MSTLWERIRGIGKSANSPLFARPLSIGGGAPQIETPLYHLSSGGIPVTKSDRIIINIKASSTVGAQYLRYKYIDVLGNIQVNEELVTVSLNDTWQTFTHVLDDGVLIEACVFSTDGLTSSGQIYVVIGLQSLGDASHVYDVCLASGYLNIRNPVSFPGGRFEGMQAWAGNLKTVSSSNPVAGSYAVIVVPDGHRYELICGKVTFVTDATVITRYVYTEIIVNSLSIWKQSTALTQTASLTWEYPFMGFNFAANPVSTSIGQGVVPFGIYLPEASELRVNAINIQAGDDFGVLNILVRDYVDSA